MITTKKKVGKKIRRCILLKKSSDCCTLSWKDFLKKESPRLSPCGKVIKNLVLNCRRLHTFNVIIFMNVFQRFHPKREQVNALQKNHDSNFDWCRDKNVSAFVWHEVERERERGENAWTFCGWRLGSTGLCSWRTRRSFYLREGVRGGNIPPCAWCWLYFFFFVKWVYLFSLSSTASSVLPAVTRTQNVQSNRNLFK